jgi:thiamine-phosphate pyrophosphorylase
VRVPRLYLITDRRLVADLPRAVERALSVLPPGLAAVQLREKDLPARELLALARALLPLCAARGAPLLVNDRLDIALSAGAGLHLPANGLPAGRARELLGPGAPLACSCHREEEVLRAKQGGADFATFGPLFDTPSKREYGPPVGLAALTAAVRLGLPLLGLGGVDLGRVADLLVAGASGAAMIRAAWAEDSGALARIGRALIAESAHVPMA